MWLEPQGPLSDMRSIKPSVPRILSVITCYWHHTSIALCHGPCDSMLAINQAKFKSSTIQLFLYHSVYDVCEDARFKMMYLFLVKKTKKIYAILLIKCKCAVVQLNKITDIFHYIETVTVRLEHTPAVACVWEIAGLHSSHVIIRKLLPNNCKMCKIQST